MRAAPLLLALLTLASTGLVACTDDEAGSEAGSDDAGTSTTTSTPDDADGGGGGDDEGVIAVRLEETEGIFIEGFDLGLRFTDAGTGDEIGRIVWSEFVATLDPADPNAYYEAVFEQPVPAGTVRLGADLNIGIGPGPEPPDLDAVPMPCEVDIEVGAGEIVTVEVAFDDTAAACMRVVS